MKYKLSACILIPRHSDCVSSKLLVSVLFIAVPTNTENLKIFLHLFEYFFSLSNCIATCTVENMCNYIQHTAYFAQVAKDSSMVMTW